MEVPERHRTTTDLHHEEWIARCGSLKAKCRSGFMVALIGNRGRGKTQMGVELLRHMGRLKYFDLVSDDVLLDRDAFEGLVEAVVNAGMYREVSKMFDNIKSGFDDKSGASADTVDKFIKPHLLILDEVQESLRSDWERVTFTRIINERYNNKLDTLMMANLSHEQFIKQVGSSVHDRIIECGGIIECTWPSFRTGE